MSRILLSTLDIDKEIMTSMVDNTLYLGCPNSAGAGNEKDNITTEDRARAL
jgi:hypothetical protein